MTRFKKEIRKKGRMLESDYPFLPYKGIESVVVKDSEARYSYYHDAIGWTHLYYNRDMSVSEISDIDY